MKKAAQLNIAALWQVTVKMLLWSNSPSPSLEAYLGVIASLGETWMARPTVLAPHFHRLASLWDPLKQKRSNQLLYLSPSWWFEPKTSTLEASDHRTEVHWPNVHFLCFTAHKVLLSYISFESFFPTLIIHFSWIAQSRPISFKNE